MECLPGGVVWTAKVRYRPRRVYAVSDHSYPYQKDRGALSAGAFAAAAVSSALIAVMFFDVKG